MNAGDFHQLCMLQWKTKSILFYEFIYFNNVILMNQSTKTKMNAATKYLFNDNHTHSIQSDFILVKILMGKNFYTP
jgi:hypothetical protein